MLTSDGASSLALVVNNPRHWLWSSHAQNILYRWCNLNPASEVFEAELGSLFIYFYFTLNNIYSSVPSSARLVLIGPCCSGTTMDSMNYQSDWLTQQWLLYRPIIAHVMNSNPDTQLGTRNKNFGPQTCTDLMHGSILLVTIPPPPTPSNPRDKFTPSGLGSPVLGVVGWGK